jgi:tRNA A-37 threonylcarbamoyl transferase component Bud32
MNSIPNNINIADYYFGFLKNLKHDSKLDLIAKLSESLKTTAKKDEVSLQSLFGAYKSDQTADEIIAELRASRTFNRKTETL